MTESSVKKVGYVFEERYLWHNPWSVQYSPLVQPFQHWEHSDTKRRFHNLLLVSGIYKKLIHLDSNIEAATMDQLQLVHGMNYIQEIQEKSAKLEGGCADKCNVETTFSQYAFDIATRAVGGGIHAVEQVMQRKVDSAYVLCRPPGHHARPSEGMGFCIFNNIAIAAKYLFKTYPETIRNIAIIDYDVHHGNGTQDIFHNDEHCLFISVHQDCNFPLNSGGVKDTGERSTCIHGHIRQGTSNSDYDHDDHDDGDDDDGSSFYTTINVPLPPGSGRGAYRCAFDTIVIPALDRFKPDFILVSSGFDASYADPLSAMMLSSEDFRYMAQSIVSAAERLCHGRTVFFHEGGYSEIYVPFCGAAVIEAMLGTEDKECIKDPFLDEVRNWGGQDLQKHQWEVIDNVVSLHGLDK